MFSVSSNELSRERGALTGRTFATLCLAIFLFLSAFVVWKAWQAADGHLIFTLDDPYLHLAVAETLLQGGYGVNFPQTSSPSSSILYTLLLAPFVALGAGAAGALGLSLTAQGAAVWLVARLIWDHLLEALPEGLRLPAGLGAALLTGLLAVSPAVSRPGRPVAAVATAATGAHLIFGKFGWLGRYEPYAVALALVALTAAGGRALSTLRPVWAGPTVSLAVLGVVAVPFLTPAKDTPAASRNIFEQQYQMHRFTTEFFPRTVAVNALGWVAYRNDGHVLDLWGLGSEEVRRATRSAGGLTPELIAELADRKGAVYAMIYDRWFKGRVPPSWCRMAVLRTSLVTAGSDEVSFYLIDPAEAPAMAGALARFAPTLPAGASLEVIPCPRP
ncbi:hypothetical protein LV780_19440 (plasmid) [Cereibacter azotoformans]|uniref:hypothetical protein n=1 Tax=Cereibacter azotoformans TaxID=43057 RepID=UPI000E35A370|nr:hypothetical protein [Cereibacter azotoformans]AXQ95947.1 hypothetical protein D0Z66_19500 [Cereibacter sphaeroides]UIJ33016.1 hypothetical protein LV780_19440 [Cereibacter azotoformans]